jgi:hypothetical protein
MQKVTTRQKVGVVKSISLLFRSEAVAEFFEDLVLDFNLQSHELV